MNSIFIGSIIVTVVLVLFMLFLASCYKKVKQEGEAIIINGYSDTTVTFTGAISWPIVNSWQLIDITRKKISVVRIGVDKESGEETEGLHCKDNIRADLKVDFYIGVNHEHEDVKKVAKTFTPKGASDINVLKEHFSPKFSEALKTTCKQFDFDELFERREAFRDAVLEVIGKEMDGFKIYDVVIDKLDQTALSAHNPNNVLDSEGIRKIQEITSRRSIETNIITEDKETKLKEKSVSAIQQRLQLDQAQKKSEAQQKREIDVFTAQEKAMSKEKEEGYLLQENTARIKREEEEEKLEEQKKMEVRVAVLNNDKKIKVQEEDVIRAQKLEQVLTSKETALKEAEKDIVVEEGAKGVAEIHSQRVEIERKIAKEEEETKNLRAYETVNREKKIRITEAEANAEAAQVELITKAKAEKSAAVDNASRVKTDAEADLDRIEKEAKGISALAEAKKLELAAIGLAEVEVEERRAQAIEKTGRAQAISIREIGLATAEAKKAELEAAESGSESGVEYAKWLRTQEIEEKRILASIDADKEVGVESAKAVGSAISNADVKLFGGEGLESIRKTIMGSASLDAAIGGSKHLSKAAERYDGDEENLIKDIKEVLQKSEVSTGDIANLSISQILTKHPDVINQLTSILKSK